MTVRFHPSAFVYHSCAFLLTLTRHIHKPNKTPLVAFFWCRMTPLPPAPTHLPRGPKKEVSAAILSAGDSWAGKRRTPDGGLCGGLPFILGCKQSEQLHYKRVIYSLLPKPSSVGSFMDFVTKGYQCAWCFDLCGHCRTGERAVASSICGLVFTGPANGYLPVILPRCPDHWFFCFFLLLTIAVISHSEARVLSSPI